jgi:4-hydroxy-2-oxoglutarate aldolase
VNDRGDPAAGGAAEDSSAPAGVTPSFDARLSGVFAPICTPFARDESVDDGALRENLARYAVSGLLGYLALGSNGENRSLSEDERLHVLDLIVRHKGSGQIVLAGATYDAQRETERFLAGAADAGADFGLVLSPGYFRKQMTDDVLYRYFSTLADTSPLPLLLYNAPGFCGVTLSPSLVGRLAGHPNIVGMKDSASSGVEQFLPLQSAHFSVLAGSANFLFPAMMGGSSGGTVSLANSFPAVALRLYEYGRDRDERDGVPCQEWVSRVNNAISGTYGVPGVKAAMDLAGYVGGIPRRPLLPLEPGQVEAMRELLSKEGLLG